MVVSGLGDGGYENEMMEGPSENVTVRVRMMMLVRELRMMNKKDDRVVGGLYDAQWGDTVEVLLVAE
ncbi:hypothetical protein GOBAR_AA27248 [Gossypium barbadense]|uniref:Uncharacterized protein n=1 Tax=Gossypium barbadense TaxID=3634 RepID=A0A2P5WQT8_GOSBA|nr:hypothetical protein GOBAR_AA27248 [Gossypium barbadense]